MHDGFLHIVTAKHCAIGTGDDPFTARFNRISGGSVEARFDVHYQQAPWRWYFHEDRAVDVAVIIAPLDLDGGGVDYLPLSSELFMPENLESDLIGVGDQTFTVGLFRRLHGKKSNFPIVHAGSIAAMPSDELVPVNDWEDRSKGLDIEAYLVEQQSLGGLSGSPVFVRSSVAVNGLRTADGIENVLLQRDRFYLMGLWHGAWEAPPDEVLGAETGPGVRVPVGMGIVVPSSKILEVLNMPEMQSDRDAARQEAEDDMLPKADYAASRPKNVEGDAVLARMLSTPPDPKK